jgi:hypothetical protein
MTIPYGGTRQFPEPPETFKCSIFLVGGPVQVESS